MFKLSSKNKPKSSPGGRNPKQSKRKADTRGGKKGNRNVKRVEKKEEKIMKTDVTKENTHQPPWAIASKKTSPTSSIPLNDQTLLSLSSWTPFNPFRTSTSLTFLGSLTSQLPKLRTPEIAFLGRSNVGKSSLLNALTSSNEARVGKTPGATASVNYYSLKSDKGKDLLTFVDLPGFGYAKLSKERKDDISKTAEKYLNESPALALGILLVDIRRDVSEQDRSVLAALYDMNVPLLIVATKSDKVKDPEYEKLKITQGLGLPEGQPLIVSSVGGEGLKDLWGVILEGCRELVDDVNGEGSSGRGEFGEEEEGEEVYDQGYDWLQSFNDDIVYEDDEKFVEIDPQVELNRVKQLNDPQNQRITLKSSLKKLKKMEKDDEVF
ncbi:hypothetical protein TL16_g04522 [Triparma laevis f. inornata]|uniref:EngB-type G domain-containing protein n=1 Tax=Triparma laevis f. inornata TaxID=1714386 RepID=A0A9W7AFJ1_9STRA|nr:hypothetical protein TL16_g04522 [Triparma laevis f. inornata]